MKRNLLLLAVMIWMAFGFTLAQAQDNGIPDTLYLESWPDDEGLYWPGPWDVKIAAYITSDIPDPVIDSIAGIVIPLCFTSSNAGANATILAAKNNTNLAPFPDLDNSIFQHLPDMGTETVSNFMMTYAEGLIVAIKAEQAAQELYTSLAEATDDPNLAAVFMALAGEEAKHKQRFELEYEEAVLEGV